MVFHASVSLLSPVIGFSSSGIFSKTCGDIAEFLFFTVSITLGTNRETDYFGNKKITRYSYLAL
jgi:hypothetical protein